ncbi:DUF6884 domain-containing protein [Haloarcula japonica]|uniref:DUF6884 domain-containing protein n=1 Tax=Haloarcula japonica TaxID=29282 RepID=UPI0039F68EFA
MEPGDPALVDWYPREDELIDDKLETARAYQRAVPDGDYLEDFFELMESVAEERQFFVKDWHHRNGDLDLDIETDPDDVKHPDSIDEMFCDECDEFQFSLGVIGDKHICHGCWEDGDWENQGQLIGYDGIDRTTYALVGCGASKKDGTHPAKELYDSTYFEKKRDFAEQLADEWFIISAKYGVLDPDREIADYDVSIDDVPVDGWIKRVDAYLRNEVDFQPEDEVYVLLGKKYLEAEDDNGESLRDRLDSYDVQVRYPFDETSGIGEQNQWLNKCVEKGRIGSPTAMIDDGQTELSNF